MAHGAGPGRENHEEPMSVKAGPPFSLFVDASGDPLSSGYVYIGTANADPITSPTAVYSDAALTVAVAQPIRTLAGVPVANGTPINLFVGGNYSMTVKDRNGVTVYTVPSLALSGSGGGDITLATGETLEAQSGSTIDMKDGSTLNLGDASGGGANVVVAATTRITGNWVPAGADALGTDTERWDAFLGTADVDTLNGDVVYTTTNEQNPASQLALAALDLNKCILACGFYDASAGTFTTSFNVASIADDSGVPGRWTITLDQAVPDACAVIVTAAGGGSHNLSPRYGWGDVTPASSGASIRARVSDGSSFTDSDFSFLVIGPPRTLPT